MASSGCTLQMRDSLANHNPGESPTGEGGPLTQHWAMSDLVSLQLEARLAWLASFCAGNLKSEVPGEEGPSEVLVCSFPWSQAHKVYLSSFLCSKSKFAAEVCHFQKLWNSP